jgi:DNA-binding CsgD family transcriptional regulator
MMRNSRLQFPATVLEMKRAGKDALTSPGPEHSGLYERTETMPTSGTIPSAGDSATTCFCDDRRVISFEPDFDACRCGIIRRRIARQFYKVGHVIATFRHQRGYQYIKLRGRPYYVHRAVADAFYGPIPVGMVVNHIDGDKQNNRVENLEICTQAENVMHAMMTGLTKKSAILAKGSEIAALRKSGLSHRKIAQELGLSKAAVTKALKQLSKLDANE